MVRYEIKHGQPKGMMDGWNYQEHSPVSLSIILLSVRECVATTRWVSRFPGSRITGSIRSVYATTREAPDSPGVHNLCRGDSWMSLPRGSALHEYDLVEGRTRDIVSLVLPNSHS